MAPSSHRRPAITRPAGSCKRCICQMQSPWAYWSGGGLQALLQCAQQQLEELLAVLCELSTQPCTSHLASSRLQVHHVPVTQGFTCMCNASWQIECFDFRATALCASCGHAAYDATGQGEHQKVWRAQQAGGLDGVCVRSGPAPAGWRG